MALRARKVSGASEKRLRCRLGLNIRGSLIENNVITNETDLMHIILYCYDLQVA